LTRAEADALRARNPSLSPWRVIGAQAAFGLLIAALIGAVTGTLAAAASALYGAAVVVVPGALMARGTTSPMARLSPATGALSVMVWAALKMAASVLMLALAPQVVRPLSWPALLIALVSCMQVYWLALLWRGRSKN
jgi:ATP synthase protein I